MRILHTSDWHLGRSFFGADLLPAQARFADHLVGLVEEQGVDAVLVAGDVYDRAIPSHDAMELYDDTMTRLLGLGAQVVVTSGNHDSFMRLGVGRRQLAAAGLHLRTRLSDIDTPVVLDAGGVAVYGIPYLEPGQVCERFGTARTHTAVLGYAMDRIREHAAAHHPQARVIVMAHAFVSGGQASESERPIEIGGVGAASADVFTGADYTALGHLHRPQLIGPDVRYCGSPLPYSFAEAAGAKQLVLLDTEALPDDDARIAQQTLELPPFEEVVTLRGSLNEVIAQAPDHRSALVSAELTDSHRVPGALARLRESFDRLIRFDWVNATDVELTAPPVSTDAAPSDAEVFAGFILAVTGRAVTDSEQRRFAAAHAQALREDA